MLILQFSVDDHLDVASAQVPPRNVMLDNGRRSLQKEAAEPLTHPNPNFGVEVALVPLAINPQFPGRRPDLNLVRNAVQHEISVFLGVKSERGNDGRISVHDDTPSFTALEAELSYVIDTHDASRRLFVESDFALHAIDGDRFGGVVSN